jgi:hypothetical protein
MEGVEDVDHGRTIYTQRAGFGTREISTTRSGLDVCAIT